MPSETLDDPVFGSLRWEDGYYSGAVVLLPGCSPTLVTIESELADPSYDETLSLVAASGQLCQRLTPEIETELRRQAAKEVVDASHQQSEGETALKEVEELAQNLSLESVGFFEGMAQLAWRSTKFFPRQTITLQIDDELVVDEVMVQD